MAAGWASVSSPRLRARYLSYHPDAAQYLALVEFAFFQLNPKGARFIAGFGKFIPRAALLRMVRTLQSPA